MIILINYLKMDFSIEDEEYERSVFGDNILELYTNKQFIKDGQKEYDLKEVEHNPLTEEDKKAILSYIESISDKVSKTSYVKLYVVDAYKYLIEERRKHVDSNFDFIPDDFINKCIERCRQYYYYQYFMPIYGALYKDFKEVCRIPGQMPKIVREMITPNTWIYDNFHGLVKNDGTYTLEGTGLSFV